MAAGQVYNQDTLIRGLQQIIADFPQDPVADLARIHLSTFEPSAIAQANPVSDTTSAGNANAAASANTPAVNTVQAPKHLFVFNPGELHYVILLVKTSNLAVQTVKLNLNNFNNTYFSLQHFNLSSFYINNTQQMVTVAKFFNKDNAMDYYNILIKNENFAPEIANGNIVVYPISASNYTTYYNKAADRPSYEQFLQENYFKQ